MSLKLQRAREWLTRRSRKPRKNYPLATVAFYGPTDARATKLVAGVFVEASHEPFALERWLLNERDVRYDEQVTLELVNWLKDYDVQQLVMPQRILGCPHEEGVDYPEGEPCPMCPYWANRDRFTGAPIPENSLGDEADEADDDEDAEDAEDAEVMNLVYSPLCQVYVREGVTLDVQIYRGPDGGWSLEVVNEDGASTVWNDLFASDDAAWGEFLRTLGEEGLGAFIDG